MAFPQNPTIGDLYTYGGKTFRWDGASWSKIFGGISSDFYPTVNEGFSLGTASNKWGNLHLSGNTIYLGQTKLESSSDGSLSIKSTNAQVTSSISLAANGMQTGSVSNSFTQVAVGTYDQRPTNPANGMLRFNSTNNWIEYSFNNVWYCVAGIDTRGIVATGGTMSVNSGYVYHEFTSSTNFVVSNAPAGSNVDILLVAGGGGGGGAVMGGGGGAGGMLEYANLSLSAGTYAVTVGGGGSGGSGQRVRGTNGSNSCIASFSGTSLAQGGGGGGSWDGTPAQCGCVGGSGGGNSGYNNSVNPPGIPGQGSSGGIGGFHGAGGGGGKSQGGLNGSVADGGNGGCGKAWLNGLFYAGGGGGGDWCGTGASIGGCGGGGYGAPGPADSSGGFATSGNACTGGGGGGANGYNPTPAASCGASGGSGIVIIRYRI